MELFSHRNGYQPAQKALQRDCVDDELRNRLWSAITVYVWNKWSESDRYKPYRTANGHLISHLVTQLWIHYFKLPIDTLPGFKEGNPSGYDCIRNHFFETPWWGVYNFLEFTLDNVPKEWATSVVEISNEFLRQENSAYRVSGTRVVAITDDTELAAVDEACKVDFAEVRSHLDQGLALLADRKAPDYRNSIKESICAVEALCQTVARKPGATLPDCLKALRVHCPIHPAFEGGLIKLYGYTSDSGGIRHALTEDTTVPTFADAKFMLVAASAFVNFLITRSAEVGLALET